MAAHLLSRPCRLVIGRTLVLATICLCACSAHAQQHWKPHGPAPTTRGQVEGIAGGEVVGAVNAVTPHPTDANVLYIGTANGGIWRTANAKAASPNWTNLTPNAQSLSIGALEFDPTDAEHKTLVAGFGRFSSFVRWGGPLLGVLRTTNAGAIWTSLDGNGTLRGLNISGIAARGEVLVVSANTADETSAATPGIWRSDDTGTQWERISGRSGSGLPAGPSFDLASDPQDPNRLFTNAGSAGIYRSDDAGETWDKVSNSAIDQTLQGVGNCEMSVGMHDNVFAAIVRPRRLAAVFRSGDGGATWANMGVPTTTEQQNIQIGAHPGQQGQIHLSIAADPGDRLRVYVGGDRQPHAREGIPNADAWFPNSIGANDYTGRLFRGNAAAGAERWVHLTHDPTANGGGTAHGSAPHADSPDMDFDADGELIEGDDGGAYRRTQPHSNHGDWFSLNGDLQATEFHAVAWDANADVMVGGAQDTGSPESPLNGHRWPSISTADGAVTVVDDVATPGLSVRYSSWQNLGRFRRRTFNANNVLQSTIFPRLAVVNAFGQPLFGSFGEALTVQPQFYTPLALNKSNPERIVFGGADAVYESFDQGDTVRKLTPPVVANGLGHDPLAYGAADDEDVLYVGSGDGVFVRKRDEHGLSESQAYDGGQVRAVVVSPEDAKTAFVADAGSVYVTDNFGGSWDDITGNLPTLDPGELHSLAYRASEKAIIVGTDRGVFIATTPVFDWSPLGQDLPKAPVYHLEYDPVDDLLVAGTLGRGAWTLDLQENGDQ